MNKKMRELKEQITAKTTAAKVLMDGENKDVDKAMALLDEVDALQKEYDAEERLFNLEKANAVQTATAPVEDHVQIETKATEKETPPEPDAVSKFGAEAKVGFHLSKTMNETTAADGGYTVPEDIVTRVQEYRDAKASLLRLVRRVPVTTNKGARTFKTRAQQTGFTKVGEGAKIGAKATPQFERIEYEIEKYAGYFPVTNEVLDDSDSNLGRILIEWIGDESRVTANKLILEAINTKTAVAIDGYDGIKKAINVTLGQAFAASSKIVTNDDGLNYLDTLKDGNERYLLTPDPANTMAMRLQVGGRFIPVEVIPNNDLATEEVKSGQTVTGYKIPFILGDLEEGIVYWDRKQMNIKISDVAVVGNLNAYEEDLTLYRAIEREDVTSRDEAASGNGYIQISA